MIIIPVLKAWACFYVSPQSLKSIRKELIMWLVFGATLLRGVVLLGVAKEYRRCGGVLARWVLCGGVAESFGGWFFSLFYGQFRWKGMIGFSGAFLLRHQTWFLKLPLRIAKWALARKEFSNFNLNNILSNWELACYVVLLRRRDLSFYVPLILGS